MRLVYAASIALLPAFAAMPAGAVEDRLGQLSLPPGFEISVYAEASGVRTLAPAPELGVLFAGTRGSRLYAIFDQDGDGKAERTQVLASNLKSATGLVWHDGYLYIAEQHRIFRYRPGPSGLAPRNVEVLHDSLPDERHHGWRYATVGPDGKFYVALGAPCNICDVSGLEGTIMRMNLDGSDAEVFARGIRNSVGLDFHPTTGELWFTDNGGDRMGDDIPPDEFNHAPRAGLHFGYPHYAGGDTVSPDYVDRAPPPNAQFPAIAFGAHVAAIGMHFYRGAMLPADFRNDAFVAQHGSWNRSVPDGYRVMRIRFDENGKATGKEVFIDGWLQGRRAWGRPADVTEMPDGSLLISDDGAGVVYRVTYSGN